MKMVFVCPLKPAYIFLHRTTNTKKEENKTPELILHPTFLLHLVWGSLLWYQTSHVALDVPVLDLFTSGIERGPLTKRLTIHLYLKKTFCFKRNKIFFHPFYFITKEKQTHICSLAREGLCLPAFGQWRGFREEKQPSIRKGGSDRGKGATRT